MNKSNQNITFKGNKIQVTGRQINEGDALPTFKLTANDMSDLDNSAFAGKVLILSVVPSLDTPVCALQTKRFNQEAGALGDQVAILTVSMDLPMAQTRWCGAEGVENVTTASDFKYRGFGEDFGCYLQDLGLLCRAIFISDADGKVHHVEYVSEIAEEPNYDAALSAAKEICG